MTDNKPTCRFCKGANPYCNECSTMGIHNDVGYKSVSVTNYSVYSRISSVPALKPTKTVHAPKATSYFSCSHSFKKALKRALKPARNKVKAVHQPTLGDKYGLLFQTLKHSLNNHFIN